ncbi:Por secretion system C-terminal sorting domain-containing protein [Chryseobacterium taichungense]|uniref:Por secretion system C-terminal sorting domain-containing protein n=1 Tax=Chryseobacterium taichungense TaxID=295069 RepID=A0A1H7WDF1_9FLAO|nr:T9SS type A sorting domain-containing protein [Chryseobacterium taichungense]SEM19606.1 Por secretion system C-terminal sorting domain-containing protein [Chryseobacterium taichungense]
MKKNLLVLLLASAFCFAQNSLMVSPQTGTMITSGTITNFKLISDGSSVALVATNNASGKVFIVDINDSNPADKAANTILTTSTNVKTRIGAAIGQTITSIKNVEVNPITNAVYVMAMVSTTPYFVKLTNAGNTITALNFNTMPYCTLNFTSANCAFQDITWGGNKLFVSSNHNTLNGELGYISAPFTHNATITKRSTTIFKSNWGNTYITNAPLETLNYIKINNIEYLCGTTTCAPGFSETVSSLTNNSGLFTVRESFNVVSDYSVKTIAINNGTDAYLLDLHNNGSNNTIYRIGKKFLDGTPFTNNTYNSNAVELRDFWGTINPSLTTEEMTSFPGNFSSMAYYSPCELLTLTADFQTLAKLSVCTAALNVDEQNNKNSKFEISPNPASDVLNISYNDKVYKNIEATVFSYDGKLIKKHSIDSNNKKISISDLQAGNYLLKISNKGIDLDSKSFIKK